MARLTRTQKYASLREQLSNDKETSIESKELSSYKDRLDNVQEQLSPSPVVEEKPIIEQRRAIEEAVFKEEPKKEEYSVDGSVDKSEYSWTPFKETPNPETIKEESEETVSDDEFFASQDDNNQSQIIENPGIDEVSAEIKEDEVVEAPEEAEESQETYEEPQNIEGNDEPVIEPAFDSYPTNSQETNEAFDENAQTNQDAQTDDDTNLAGGSSYFDEFMNNDGDDSYFNTAEGIDIPVDDIFAEVFNDDSSKNNERETYLNQTLNDVNEHNANSGLETIDQIVEQSVNEVRHPEAEQIYSNVVDNTIEEPKQEEPSYEEPIEITDDNDFSNTVSMEISKIMNEMSNTIDEEIPQVEATPIEEPVINVIKEEEPEEVVEIKNISEVEKENTSGGTLSSTIPFVIAAENEEIIDDEDEEEGGSNIVLNIILIVLIIILVAVLGLIIFYILKTKGII